MLKFLKNLFFGNEKEEVFYELDVKVTVNKKENSIIIDTTRNLSTKELADIIRRYM